MRKHRQPNEVRRLLKAIALDLEKGLTIELACRKVDVSKATYFRWKQRFASALPSESLSVQELEAEIRRLKTLVANLALEKQMLQEVVKKSGDGRATSPRGAGTAAEICLLTTTGLSLVGATAVDATLSTSGA